MPPAEAGADKGPSATDSGRRPVPRLASENWRGLLAMAVSMVFYVPFLMRIGTGRQTVRDTILGVGVYWTCYVVIYMVLTWRVFRGVEGAELDRWMVTSYRKDTRGKARWLGANMSSWSMALYSSVAMVMMLIPLLVDRDLRTDAWVQLALVANMAASWLMVVLTYGLEYARRQAMEGGLSFPGEGPRRLDDYLYLASQVQTTFSSSDVELGTTRMRNRVNFQSLMAFAFNTIIIAAIVSILLSSLD